MKSSVGNRLNAATQNKTKKLHCLKLESFPCVKSLWICMLLQVTAAKVDLTVPGGGGGL